MVESDKPRTLPEKVWADHVVEAGVGAGAAREPDLIYIDLHLVLSDALYRLYPGEREGVLSRRRAVLSKGEFLCRLARALGVDADVRLSASEEGMGGRSRDSIMEDALEAIVGALYLDSDFATAQRVVLAWYGPLAERLVSIEDAENPKGRLQELVQPEHGNSALRYETTDTCGPRHAREFTVTVFLLDRQLGEGHGSSKKQAEEAAARMALETLRHHAGPATAEATVGPV